MRLLHRLDALGRCDQIHQLDVLDTAPLEAVDRGDSRAAGCQHRVEQQHVAVLDIVRQLAVILDRLQGFRIAVQADVADLGSRDHFQHAVHHAEAGAQDRHQRDLLARDYLHTRIRHRGLDRDFLERQVAGRLVAHQHGDLTGRFAEFLDAGGLVAHQAELMLDQRMIHFMYGCHSKTLLYPQFALLSDSRLRRSRSACGRRR